MNLTKYFSKVNTQAKWYRIMTRVIFPLILLLYPLRHVSMGIDLTDTGYSLGNFVFFKQMEGMWVFATYLANAVGYLLTRLPFGWTMLGMNVYTGLFISVTALVSYCFLVKEVKMAEPIAFMGELLAVSLCWCPTTLLYNYMTYQFFTFAVILLYLALRKDKKRLFVAAGIFLGMNVLVRFPNVIEVVLILAVWYYGFIKHKPFRKVAGETGWCVLGFLMGAGAVLFIIIIQYGLGGYLSGIQSLFKMTQHAQDYTAYSMIITVLQGYTKGMKWILYMLVLVGIGTALCTLFPEKLRKVICEVFAAAVILLFGWFYAAGVYNFRYYTYESMTQWAIVFLIMSIAIFISVLFSKKVSNEKKVFAGMMLLLIGVTPLGSNNQLYPNINNLFLVGPFTLSFLTQKLSEGKKAWMITGKREDNKQVSVSTYPAHIMLIMVLVMIGIQSFGFGLSFIFRDGLHGEKRDTLVTNNSVLTGMHTNAEHAANLQEISEFCDKNKLEGSFVILYGDIPSMAYVLNMPSAISTTWADLRSYTYETMEYDFKQAQLMLQSKGVRPVILVSAKVGAYLSGDKARMEELEIDEAKYAKDEKLKLIQNFIEENGYEEDFGNDEFCVLESQ